MRVRGVKGLTALLGVGLLILLNANQSVLAAAPTATLSLSKGAFVAGTNTPLTTPVTPGTAFDYQLSAACSGLTQGCIGATTTDVLPPGIDYVAADASPLYTVTYDAPSRTVKVTYTSALASPPNPAGSVGIPAGSTRTAVLHVTLDPATTAPDGSTITNTATAAASNAATDQASADITVSVPTSIVPVASKSLNPSSLVAQSGATTTATLSVGNASTGTPSVTSLTVADTTAATWDTFDLTSVGPVLGYPEGADEVSVGYCTATTLPCAPGQFIDGPFQTGTSISLPVGVDPSTVTGIRFTFSSSGGAPLPPSTQSGSVGVGLTLRDTVRTTGATIDPTRTLAQTNCASPSAVDATAGTVAGNDACATYTILPGVVGVDVSKQLFADAGGSYTPNGFPVAGQTPPSGVTGVTTATNTSAFPVASLTITDPSTSTPSNFSDITLQGLQLVFPSGATTAQGSVTCSDGSSVAINATAPPTTVRLTPTCPAPATATGVTVTYAGSIAAGASAQLGIHGTLNPAAVGGAAITDCSDGNIAGGSGGGASGTGCASLTVQAPLVAVAGAKSSSSPSTGGQLVPGQTLGFTVQATNQGNLPLSSFEIDDPSNPPPTSNNPFTYLTVTAATVSVTPASSPAPTFAIEVYQGGAWVPFTTSAAMNATGIRARLVSGLVLPNQTVRLNLTTQVSDALTPGTTISNCQVTTVAQAQGTATTPQVCSPTLTAQPPTTAGQIGKTIVPGTVTAPVPGSTPSAQVKLRVANTGNLPLSRIVITDPDPSQDDPPAFFDHVDLLSLGAVNFPPGANRVQVDACLSASACAAGTYTLGTPATTLGLPAGVSPGSVTGLRFTFTNSAGGFLLNPGSNYPSSGSCSGATVCFNVIPRTTLRSSGVAIAFPVTFSNVATAGGESPISQGQLTSFGSAPAALTVTPGAPQLAVSKTGSPANVPPGTAVSYQLTTGNSGTAPIPGLTVTEPLPPGLHFDPSFVGTGGQPWTFSATVPAGAQPVPTPTFTVSGSTLTWQFPESYLFNPTSTVTLGFQATLTAGTPGGTAVTNTFGAGTVDQPTAQALTCGGGAAPDPTIGCLASATVTAGSGSAVDAEKWVHGDDSLGFYNTVTASFVSIGDPSCPNLVVAGDDYTRYPCVAQVLAGQDYSYVIQVTNVGTTPLTQTRLVDDLPMLGDQGVIVPGPRGTEWDPRPLLGGAPAVAGGQPGTLVDSYSATAPGCLLDLSVPPGSCPAGAWTGTLAGAQAFRGFLSFSPALAPAGTTSIVVPMSAPADLSGNNQMPVAWNSFAHSDFFQVNGSTTQLRAVEPEKVGVLMPFGTLQIDKVITGPVPPGSLIGPFHLSYSCVVTPSSGAPVTVASAQDVAIDVSSPVIVSHIPVGAVCSIEETDTGGGNVTQPAPVTITPDLNPDAPTPTVATITNDFPFPGLVVTKAVAGGAAGLVSGPFTVQVACTISGAAVTGYPRDLTFDEAGSQELEDVPIGAVCTVSEPDDHGATSVDTTYDPDSHGSTVISGTVVNTASVLNTYDPATLSVSKTVVGPGPAGPWSFAASCALVSNTGTQVPIALPAVDASFTLSSGQTHAITVPVGAQCTVTEVGAPAGDTVTYDGSPTPPTVTVSGATTLSVTNRFPTPAVPGFPMTGVLPGAGGGSGTPLGSVGLAVILVGLAATGLSIVVQRRRRRQSRGDHGRESGGV